MLKCNLRAHARIRTAMRKGAKRAPVIPTGNMKMHVVSWHMKEQAAAAAVPPPGISVAKVGGVCLSPAVSAALASLPSHLTSSISGASGEHAFSLLGPHLSVSNFASQSSLGVVAASCSSTSSSTPNPNSHNLAGGASIAPVASAPSPQASSALSE